MARFADRSLQWTDVDHRFEEVSAQQHAYYAVSYIERLEIEGTRKLKEHPAQAARWRAGCQELKEYIRKLGIDQSRELHNDLREFIHVLEHTRIRLYQMSYGTADTGNTFSTQDVLDWFDIVYRHSTYAILAAHLPDKQEINTKSTHIRMNISEQGITSTVTTTGDIIEPHVPRKYRRAAKRPER